MARKATATNETAGKALIPWEEQLARDAEIAAELERNAGGGSFFSVRGGMLTFNDMPVPNNTMGVVIVDGIFENVFYEGEFDPQQATPPTCFAFAREESSLAPHETVVALKQQQNDVCAGCKQNDWGTADKGRGKACRNTRRLALIPGGAFDEKTGRFIPTSDEEAIEKAPIGFLKLPVTSVKGYAQFVKTIAGGMKLPPHGIFTKITVRPDQKNQVMVSVEPLGAIPHKLMPMIMKRREEAKTTIEQPYPLELGADEGAAKKKPAAHGAKPAAKGKAAPARKGKAGKPY